MQSILVAGVVRPTKGLVVARLVVCWIAVLVVDISFLETLDADRLGAVVSSYPKASRDTA
jgi:hypothetical protein